MNGVSMLAPFDMRTRPYETQHDADRRFLRWLGKAHKYQLVRYLSLLYQKQPREYHWKAIAINRELARRP